MAKFSKWQQISGRSNLQFRGRFALVFVLHRGRIEGGSPAKGKTFFTMNYYAKRFSPWTTMQNVFHYGSLNFN